MSIPKPKDKMAAVPACSPIKAVATGTDAALVGEVVLTGPSTFPTPVQTFMDGVVEPTFELLNQPLPEVEPNDLKPLASPACAEHIYPGSPSTASESLIKYI